MINKILFDRYGERDVWLYEISNDKIKVGITDFGGAIHSLKVKTADGWKDICLGYNTVTERIASSTYCGAIIGRVANRIRSGCFELGGARYCLSLNDGRNHLHGGATGFDKRFFRVGVKDDSLVLTYISRDGDQGYPGKLVLTVGYTLKDYTFGIKFTADSDKDTLWNPTCHTYFNLNGEESGDISDTELQIYADRYTPCDGEILPTGEIKEVKGTDFDFNESKNLGEMLSVHGGYDDNFILRSSHAASARGLKTGIELDVYTDMPAMQFYSGNFLKGNGKSREYRPHDGFCFEPQFVPDAVNIAGVAKPILKANGQKSYYIDYRFGV